VNAVKHLALVPDVGVGNDGRDLPPLEQWELYMRGAGRSNRTISETIGVMRRLENYAGSTEHSGTCIRARGRFRGQPGGHPE
jgi:integrase/recombinase XerD